MRRRLARFTFVLLLGVLATVLGTATAMLLTPPGRDLLARSVSTLLDRKVLGRVDVGYISGSFLYDLTIKRLVVRDTAGVVLANLPQVRVTYRLPSLLAGNIILTNVTLDRPVIQLIKHRNGRMNYEEVLRLGKGAPGGKSPLVELRNVRISDGTLRIALPWNPPPNARTEAARDSALRAERSKPGRRIEASAEGPRRVILLEDLTTRMPRLRIVTPDKKPFTADIDSLATRVSDPQVTLRDLRGRLRLRGDSAVFSLQRAALPGTVAHGGGAITWPDTMRYDFELIAPQVDLADLRWISPDFPAMTGRGTVVGHSVSGGHVEYTIEDLHLHHGPQKIDGRLVAITDVKHGLGVRNLKLSLDKVDLDNVRPYVDSLPFHGLLTGTMTASGYLRELTTSVDLLFEDALVPARPESHIVADGVVRTGIPSGLTFDSVSIRRSDIDLRTVRKLAPAVILEGRLAATGLLDGPLRNIDFTGTARHQDDDRPVSVIDGYVHLDTRRDTLALATDVSLDPLSFDGIRRAFPSLKSTGELRGTVRTQGTLADLEVDAEVGGALGQVGGHGRVTITPPRFGARNLDLRFRNVDLAALRGTGPQTALTGALTVTGMSDTLRAPEGDLRLQLARSRVREFTLDTLAVAVAVHDSVIKVDSAYAEWNGARAGGSGTLGWARPHAGRMVFRLAADSLVAFDSLLLATTHLTRDTASVPLNGTADATLTLGGNLDTLQLAGDFTLRGVQFQRGSADSIVGRGSWTGGGRPALSVDVRTDSMTWGTVSVARLSLGAHGPADSVSWHAGANIGPQTRIDGIGRLWVRDSIRHVDFDSLNAHLATRSWRLDAPAELVLGDSAPRLSRFSLTATDGSAAVRMEGTVPGKAASGNLTIDAFEVSLQDVFSLMGRDTAGVAGVLGMTLELGGRSAAPTLRGATNLADVRVGDAHVPYLEGVLNYGAQRLDANLFLWKTGERVMSVEAQLPIDLAFEPREKRQIPGPLHIRARGDSVELALIEAATSGVRRVSGTVTADVSVDGGWDVPELSGFAQIHDGAMSVPGIGVRYTGIGGRLELVGDSVRLKDVTLETGTRVAPGRLDLTGHIHVHNLTRPELGLHLQARRFNVIDVRNFLTLTVSGGADLTGPFYGASLTGNVDADEGVLYFADLIQKRIIDLDDPTNAELVDTTLIRRRGLRSAFQTQFLQDLKVNDLHVIATNNFWLRSTEANIALTGDVHASKVQREYRIDGTLNAERGTYTLKIGPVSRDFTVTRGQVRYFGTPDLNAELDIEAEHVVHTVTSQDIPIIARITGTLLAPKLSLESTRRPPIPESDLVSYLITGAPVAEANLLGQGAVVQSALSYLSSALSSEFERAIVSDLGLPVDLIQISPGVLTSPTGSGLTEITAGWQLGNRTFLTLNAGFCTQNFSYQRLGLSLERRFSRQWRTRLSVEPTITTCLAPGVPVNTFTTTSRYQVGFDVFWDREF